MNIIKWLRRLFGKQRTYGLIPQQVDKRDFKYKLSGTTSDSVDLFENDLPIVNQGSRNSCVGHSAGYLLSRLLDNILPEGEYYDKYSLVSDAFIWVMAKYEEGTVSQNAGVVARNAFKVITKYGFLSKYLYDFSYDTNKVPSKDKLELATVYRLLLNYLPRYYGISELLTRKMLYIKNAISNGSPVSIAIPVYKPFQNYKGGVIDEVGTGFYGYHDIVIGGYETNEEGTVIFKGRNSWGTSWGDRGYFYITEDVLKELAFDIWTLK